MEGFDINKNCCCFVYLFSEGSKKGINFLSNSTRDDLQQNKFEVKDALIHTVEWDEKIQSHDGTDYTLTHYGYVTDKTYVLKPEELLRIFNLLQMSKNETIVQVEINQEMIIEINDNYIKTLKKEKKN